MDMAGLIRVISPHVLYYLFVWACYFGVILAQWLRIIYIMINE